MNWQRTLRAWPELDRAPAATPFVSIYAREHLVGCFGSDEGLPGERISRAFLRALGDTRHHAFGAAERPSLLAHVAYPIAPFRIDPDRDADQLEAGTHGLVRISPGSTGVLLPSVSRDGGHGVDALLHRLAEKSGVMRAQLGEGLVFAFSTETVATIDTAAGDPRALALAWLAALVDSRGAITFAVDARRRTRTDVGPMHHGRAAIVVSALASSTRWSRLAQRARSRLGDDARAALRGEKVAGWPETPERVGGTLALLRLAEAIDDAPLLAWIDQHRRVGFSAWHAGQCVAALGERAPEWQWRACVRDLDRQPWAPWTLLGARRRGDSTVVERAAAAVTASLLGPGAHQGGATATPVPEIALTALAVESLRGLSTGTARKAVARGRAFLRRWQLLPATLLGAHDPALAIGAFPGSPIADGLRADITAHAVLALR